MSRSTWHTWNKKDRTTLSHNFNSRRRRKLSENQQLQPQLQLRGTDTCFKFSEKETKSFSTPSEESLQTWRRDKRPNGKIPDGKNHQLTEILTITTSRPGQIYLTVVILISHALGHFKALFKYLRLEIIRFGISAFGIFSWSPSPWLWDWNCQSFLRLSGSSGSLGSLGNCGSNGS